MKTIVVKTPNIIRYETPRVKKPEIIKKRNKIKRYKHRINPTSMLAYLEILENLGERQRIVYRAIRELKSANNLMIAKHLGLSINQVTGRVFELRKFGVVREDKKELCPYTNRLTTYWKVVRRL